MDMDGGLLWPVTRVLITLIGVCVVAWVALVWLSRRGFAGPQAGGRLKLLERLPLGQRRQLYLVQADSRVFLVGAAETGALALIAELDATQPQRPDA